MNIRQITTDEIIETGNYDDCVNLGKQAKDDVDNGRWIIGDLGNALKQRYEDDNLQWYGKNIIDEFAKDIQTEKATVQEYRNMAKYYPPDDRARLTERYAANWSVLKVAKRFKSLRRSEAFLRLCSSEGIHTVDDYARRAGELKGKPSKPKKLVHADFLCSRSEAGTVTLIAHDLPPAVMKKMALGVVYTVDVWSKEAVESDET